MHGDHDRQGSNEDDAKAMGLSIESATTAELTKASVCLFRAKFRLPYGCQLHKEYDLKYWQIEAARAAIVRHMERQK